MSDDRMEWSEDGLRNCRVGPCTDSCDTREEAIAIRSAWEKRACEAEACIASLEQQLAALKESHAELMRVLELYQATAADEMKYGPGFKRADDLSESALQHAREVQKL